MIVSEYVALLLPVKLPTLTPMAFDVPPDVLISSAVNSNVVVAFESPALVLTL